MSGKPQHSEGSRRKVSDFNFKGLDTTEEPNAFPEYFGPQPPKGILLIGAIRVWGTLSKAGNRTLKIAFTTAGTLYPSVVQYEGFTVWEDMPLLNTTKFRWHRFMTALGVTPDDLVKRTKVGPQEDIGYPILSIGRVNLAGIYAGIKLTYEEYEGAQTPRVHAWIPHNMIAERAQILEAQKPATVPTAPQSDEPPF